MRMQENKSVAATPQLCGRVVQEDSEERKSNGRTLGNEARTDFVSKEKLCNPKAVVNMMAA